MADVLTAHVVCKYPNSTRVALLKNGNRFAHSDCDSEADADWLVSQIAAFASPASGDAVHGVNCQKAPHTGTGYGHAENDDSPYDIDGAMYCGRCHYAMCVPAKAAPPPSPKMRTACEEARNWLNRMAESYREANAPYVEVEELVAHLDAALASAATPEGCTKAERELIEFVWKHGLKKCSNELLEGYTDIITRVDFERDERSAAAASARRGEGV